MVATRIPWRRLWLLARVLARYGRRVSQNLTADEWREVRTLVAKGARGRSKRTPWRNLSDRELKRLRQLVQQAATGRGKKAS
jgi:hypothetical protein